MAPNTGDRIVELSILADGGEVEVAISNNGRPIPGEILEKLLKKAVTGKKEGTGVGLLITRDLLMNNDGSINVGNMGATGVKITTRLPLYRDEAQGRKSG